MATNLMSFILSHWLKRLPKEEQQAFKKDYMSLEAFEEKVRQVAKAGARR